MSTTQGAGAAAARIALDQGIEAGAVPATLDLRFVHHSFELVLREVSREVEQGSGDGRDRNAVDGRDLVVGEQRPVERDCLTRTL